MVLPFTPSMCTSATILLTGVTFQIPSVGSGGLATIGRYVGVRHFFCLYSVPAVACRPAPAASGLSMAQLLVIRSTLAHALVLRSKRCMMQLAQASGAGPLLRAAAQPPGPGQLLVGLCLLVVIIFFLTPGSIKWLVKTSAVFGAIGQAVSCPSADSNSTSKHGKEHSWSIYV
jgi:hypothetical protein